MKFYKPTSPSRRNMSGIEYRKFITAAEPLKALVKTLKSKSGRNNTGRITVRHQGGGVKRQYRLVDFRQKLWDVPAKVEAIEYDPYRTSFIARVVYKTGQRAYILAPQGLKVGDEIAASQRPAALKHGNRMPLKDIPVGTGVYNVELSPGQGGKLARSAGVTATILAREGGYVNLSLPSGEVRKVLETCAASLGELSNPERKTVTIGKAGRSRHLGRRPTVRGTAMNPVDHPHGGGEGRQPRGLKRSKNYWGSGIRGVKTRRKKKMSSKFILSRRK
ncbi:MAG: 50S ribosomal protein L2 [Parcubacteria group bacterium]|nr:50S ribosomal protein L2 [Parcubacteria group bacterium]